MKKLVLTFDPAVIEMKVKDSRTFEILAFMIATINHDIEEVDIDKWLAEMFDKKKGNGLTLIKVDDANYRFGKPFRSGKEWIHYGEITKIAIL